MSTNSQTGVLDRSAVAAQPHKRRIWLRVAALIVLGFAIDAMFVEPYRVEVTHFDVPALIAAPLKIAHLTDLHTHGIGPRERKIFSALAAENPDVIVITGDTLAGFGGTYDDCKELYQQLHAPLGVWFVLGNWEFDHPIRPARRERDFYESSGVHLLAGENAQLRPGIWLVGISNSFRQPLRTDALLARIPPDAYKIALFHEPAIFDRVAGHVDLALSGHTHGGQVRIPFVYPFWLPSGSGHYLEGWYDQAGSKMYVSRGIGMSALPIRFLCRPEVTIITLKPSTGNT
jgi:predicted MPP superfamily phosphohydrolase